MQVATGISDRTFILLLADDYAVLAHRSVVDLTSTSIGLGVVRARRCTGSNKRTRIHRLAQPPREVYTTPSHVISKAQSRGKNELPTSAAIDPH